MLLFFYFILKKEFCIRINTKRIIRVESPQVYGLLCGLYEFQCDPAQLHESQGGAPRPLELLVNQPAGPAEAGIQGGPHGIPQVYHATHQLEVGGFPSQLQNLPKKQKNM